MKEAAIAFLLLMTLGGCSLMGQTVYDSAKATECSRQGEKHCDPLNNNGGSTDIDLIGTQGENSNEALEEYARKQRK